MFFFKRNTIVVDCFTTNSSVNDLFPIQKASKFYPQWWKDLPKTFELPNNWGLTIPHATMKGCIGFTNTYNNGFMIPLWADLLVQTDPTNWLYQFSTAHKVDSHDKEQIGSDLYHHLKLISPWTLKEKSGVKFMWTSAFYNQLAELSAYHILPGIMDFKYNHGTNVNMFFPKVDNKILFKAGTPLAHIIPMSENKVEIKTHVVTEAEMEKIEPASYVSTFINKYDINKKILKAKEKGCPFAK